MDFSSFTFILSSIGFQSEGQGLLALEGKDDFCVALAPRPLGIPRFLLQLETPRVVRSIQWANLMHLGTGVGSISACLFWRTGAVPNPISYFGL